MLAGVARWYLLASALLDLGPLYQLWVLGESMATVNPFTAQNANADLRSVFSMVVSILAVVRIFGFAAGSCLTQAHKWGIVAMHLVVLGFVGPMYATNVVARRAAMPEDQRTLVDFFMGVTALNPLIFAAFLRPATLVPKKKT
jgi:hypothetical protein